MRSIHPIAKCRRGSTLLIAIIFIMILGLVEMANLYLKGQQEIIVRSETNTTKCFNLAEAGFERMRRWAQKLNNFPDNPIPLIATKGYNPFNPNHLGNIPTQLGVAGETYLTTIQLDTVHSGSGPSNPPRFYIVRSSGTAGNFIKPIWATIKISTFPNIPYSYSVDKFIEEPTRRRPGS